MKFFEDTLSNSVFSNRDAMQLAGLSVLGGEMNVGKAIADGLTQSAQMKEQQRAQADYDRQQKMRAALPELMSQVDFSKPQEAFVKLVPIMGVEQASQLVKARTEAATEERLQQRQNIVLGGNGASQGGMDLQSASEADLIKMAIIPELAPMIKLELDRRKLGNDRDYERNEKPLSGESAAKLALVRQGTRGVSQVKELAFGKDGELRKDLVAQITNIPLVGSVQLTPEAKKLYNTLYRMTSAKLRLETGASAADKEVRENLRAFAPGLLDDKDSALYKIDELDNFFVDYADLMGRPLPAGSGGGNSSSSNEMRPHGWLSENDPGNPPSNVTPQKIDPRVQQAIDAGYSENEIAQYLQSMGAK